MNKQELCNQLSKTTKMSKAKCMAFIDHTFNAIEGSLKKGQEVRLVGFGSWRKTRRKAHRAAIRRPERNSPFRPAM